MNRFATFIAAALLAPLLASAQIAIPSYGGLWWKSPSGSESGWGLNIAHQGAILFATWFTYDREGNGMWLVMPSAGQVPQIDNDPYYPTLPSGVVEYQGMVYRVTGPAFDSATFNPASVSATAVGSASLRFTSTNVGTFNYTVDGVMQSKAITRQVFGPMPTCDFSAAGASLNFQDLWWRSPAGSESGWGVNITHQGDIIFATWFTYDSAGKGMWLVISGAVKSGNNTYAGAIYRTRGPAFDTALWDSTKVQATQIGTATFTFSDASNGTFAYTVNGVSQTKAITRQVFANPATICR